MKDAFHSEFISAIHNKKKVMITFYSHEDKDYLQRKCAPMDYAASRRDRSMTLKYQVWDYDSDKKPHPLGLLADQIRSFVVLEESFEPSEFINWDTRKSPWSVERDWGIHS